MSVPFRPAANSIQKGLCAAFPLFGFPQRPSAHTLTQADASTGYQSFFNAAPGRQPGALLVRDQPHAAALGRLDLVEHIVEGSNDNPALLPLSTVSELARQEKGKALTEACRCGHAAIAAYLLDHGASPGAQGDSGQTGLHLATHSGRLDLLTLLLEHHAPLETRNSFGGAVLEQAVWSALNDPQSRHLFLIETLIRAGADTSVVGYPTGDKNIDDLFRRESTWKIST
ncbi:MAG: ankyrin repeat domain-containing protein [Oxalobacteraceae bacterium]|nr:MAG: ankyrin repeat domain-containing protein [Oxalobacteraceae bacterium]